MTQIIIRRRGQGYELVARGHATPEQSRLEAAEQRSGGDAGEKVCAAISMLTSTLALSLQVLPGIDHDGVCVDAGAGYIRVRAQKSAAVKTLFQSAFCGAAALQRTHPERVCLQADKIFSKIAESFDAI